MISRLINTFWSNMFLAAQIQGSVAFLCHSKGEYIWTLRFLIKIKLSDVLTLVKVNL